MLAVLLATIGIGIAGADSASVVASYTSTYASATCAMSLYQGQSSIDLSAAAGSILYVMNSGSPDSLGTPVYMPVTVAFNDASAGSAANGGWYTGYTPTPTGSWVPGMTTYWTASGTGGANGPFSLDSLTSMQASSPAEGPAYSGLPSEGSGGSAWYPISFSVTAPAALPAGTYIQQIVISGSC